MFIASRRIVLAINILEAERCRAYLSYRSRTMTLLSPAEQLRSWKWFGLDGFGIGDIPHTRTSMAAIMLTDNSLHDAFLMRPWGGRGMW